MLRVFISGCFFFFSVNRIAAQENIPEFGKVNLDDLSMKECPFDKNANAMNLVKNAKMSFETNDSYEVPKSSIEYWVRIKIFNERGFSSADIKIPYISKGHFSKITDIEAFIYHVDANGQAIKEKVERKDIFRKKSKAKNSIDEIAFTFPDLQKGSVIEYKYTRVEKNLFGAEPWFFQDDLPTAYSHVVLAVPTYMRLAYHLIAFQTVKKDSSFKRNGGNFFDEHLYSFSMNNIPSFKYEPFMGSLADNVERIEFDLSSSAFLDFFHETLDQKWRYYNFYLLEKRYFGRAFDKPVQQEDSLIGWVSKIKHTEEKIAFIYQYIKNRVEWDQELTFYTDSVEKVFTKKTGNSGDMNILLLNLLRKAQVPCYPLLVSTRENGKTDENFASLSQFNSVVVLALDSDFVYILDCTQKDLSYKIPPLSTLNRKAFLVDTGISRWVFLSDPRVLMKNQVNVMVTMDSAGNMTGKTRLALIGFAKSEELSEQKKKKESDQQGDADREAPLDLSDDAENLIVDTAFTEPGSENSDTLVEQTYFHFTPPSTGDHYFLSPFLFAYFKKNPFTDSARQYDIDFGCAQTYHLTLYMKIADNFLIQEAPKTISIRMEDSSILFRRDIFQNDNEIMIRITFAINGFYFAKDSYPQVKSFFDKVYSLINEVVLIKKK